MNRRPIREIVIPTGEAQNYLRNTLHQFIGAPALQMNTLEFIACVFNEILCDSKALDCQEVEPFYRYDPIMDVPGWVTDHKTADEILFDYGLPSDPTYQVYKFVKHGLENIVYGITGGLDENLDYEFKMSLFGDIRLYELKPHARPQPDPAQSFIKSVQEGLDRGDWYPEHVRRLAGRP